MSVKVIVGSRQSAVGKKSVHIVEWLNCLYHHILGELQKLPQELNQFIHPPAGGPKINNLAI